MIETYERNTTWDFLKKYWYVIVAGIMLLIGRGRWGTIPPYDKATILALLVIATITWGQLMWGDFKNKTGKLITNPIHTTTRGRFTDAGDYSIFTMGDVDAYGIHLDGGDGTIIVPRSTINKLGQSAVCAVRTKEVEMDKLPPEVIEVIQANKKKFKPPLYLGLIDEAQYPGGVFTNKKEKDYNVTFLIEKVEQLHKQIALLKDIIAGRMGAIEEYVSSFGRIQTRAKGGLWEKAKRELMGEEE